MSGTIRMVIPQWKGGDNRNYYFGAQLLAFIAPPSSQEKLVEVAIEPPSSNLEIKNEEILYSEEQLDELERIKNFLTQEQPDRIIVFGGDCSVSQGPFDFLNGKYDEKVGLVWLDAHPDISTKAISNHNHEFVLANLLGLGDSVFSKEVNHPFSANKTIYAGLVEDPQEKLKALDLTIDNVTPDELLTRFDKFEQWIDREKIEKLCVHFDLDALSPEGFRSLTSAKPYQTPEEYGAAVGKLTLNEVVEFLNRLNQKAEVVGLAIAEHLPWDAINLRAALAELPIFEAD